MTDPLLIWQTDRLEDGQADTFYVHYLPASRTCMALRDWTSSKRLSACCCAQLTVADICETMA